MCDLNLQREWVIFHQVRTCSSISWWQQVTFRHNRPLGHSILVPRHPALSHYPRSETSGSDTTVHSDTLSSFRDIRHWHNSLLRHIILVPRQQSTQTHYTRSQFTPTNYTRSQSTQTHYPRSETSGTDTTVHSDTLSSFRDIQHWHNSPLRHIILVPRHPALTRQSTQTHYPRSETTVHSDTLYSFPVHSDTLYSFPVHSNTLSSFRDIRHWHNSPLRHIILVPRHPALTQQFTQTHYPRSETSGTETTVHSDTLSSFRDNSPLRQIIFVPRHPALTQQSTWTHYPRSQSTKTHYPHSETSGHSDTLSSFPVHSDTLFSFREISPLRHIILVQRQQSTRTHYPRSETSVHSATLSSIPVHSDTLSSFRDISPSDTVSSFRDISPLKHTILVPRQQSTRTHYPRSETTVH
jgi:hypothetical protein